MATAKIRREISLHIDCPACGEGKFDVTDIEVGKAMGPWPCHECGAWFRFSRVSEDEVEALDTGQRSERRLVVLESKGPVRLVIDSRHQPEYQTPEHLEFLYNEHTCPTNFLTDVVEVIDPETGQDDPHGIFAFVKVGPWHDVEENGPGWTSEAAPRS